MAKHPLYMIAVTASTGGLALLWSILLSSGTPFLVSVGFAGSWTALVWSIAPFMGTFVQPCFGAWSDANPRSRRHFLIGGAIGTSTCLVGLGSSRLQGLAVARLLRNDSAAVLAIQISALGWFSALNVCIQLLQMASRAIIVENNDAEDQVHAAAWASRMQGIGGILGYLLGCIDFDADAHNQFLCLCVVGALAVLFAAVITLSTMKQPGRTALVTVRDAEKTVKASFGTYARALPREVFQIFVIQFLAWMGWFPLRTYYTAWLVDMYVVQLHWPTSGSSDDNVLQAHAAYSGSIAGIWMSLVALLANIALPSITRLLERTSQRVEWKRDETAWPNERQPRTSRAMIQIWAASQMFFGFAMLISGYISTERAAMILMASVGLSWAVTLWVPFCLMGLLLSRQRQTTVVGAVMGLHNAAISVPQIVSALICSSIFSATEQTGTGNLCSLLSGGCWALVSGSAIVLFFDSLQSI